MAAFISALYAEGSTDERFLPILIQRTAVDLLSRQSHTIVDVSEPMLINPAEKRSRAENIVAVAQQVAGYHLLFVHADADHSTSNRAYNERIQPGMGLIHHARREGRPICTDIVPVIPVYMTEAWMLADQTALLDLIGTTVSPQELPLPERIQQIETIANPKERLAQIMQMAIANRPRRIRRQRSINELYEPLGRRIGLPHLMQLPSYQQFVKDLSLALTQLNFIRQNR